LAGLVLDRVELELYLLDPNGTASYFNSVTSLDIVQNIEETLKNYFNLVNLAGYQFEFRFSSKWNSNRFSINNEFKNENVGSGHCLILTIMLCHLVNEYNKKPCEAFNLMRNLNTEELLFLITQYYCGLYSILKINKQLPHEQAFLTLHFYYTVFEYHKKGSISQFITEIKKKSPLYKTLDDLNQHLDKFGYSSS
jgi:hypothetical protein